MRFLIALLMLTVLQARSLRSAAQKRTRYDNYAVYRIYINSPEQRRVVNNLLNSTNRYNLWHNGHLEMHLMIHPDELSNFRIIMSREGLSTQLLIPNVQALIDAERNG